MLVVCGAGASSTFLVHWMRRDIAARGLAAEVSAGSSHDVARRLADVDVLLVGAHLRSSYADLAAAASAVGVRAVLLPDLGYDAAGAAVAVDLALAAPIGERESANG